MKKRPETLVNYINDSLSREAKEYYGFLYEEESDFLMGKTPVTIPDFIEEE